MRTRLIALQLDKARPVYTSEPGFQNFRGFASKAMLFLLIPRLDSSRCPSRQSLVKDRPVS